MTYSLRFKSRFAINQVLITTAAPHCALVASTTRAERIAFVLAVEALAKAGA